MTIQLQDNLSDKGVGTIDQEQIFGYVYNHSDKSLSTSSFLTGKAGRKVSKVNTAAENLGGSLAGDDFIYSEEGDTLYTIRVLYSDVTKTQLNSVERI